MGNFKYIIFSLLLLQLCSCVDKVTGEGVSNEEEEKTTETKSPSQNVRAEKNASVSSEGLGVTLPSDSIADQDAIEEDSTNVLSLEIQSKVIVAVNTEAGRGYFVDSEGGGICLISSLIKSLRFRRDLLQL